jgi:hypothetical protein
MPESVEEAVQERMRLWKSSLKAGDILEEHLCETAALESIRVWYCRTAMKAQVEESWDEDRRLAAAQLGRKLADDPLVVSHTLESTLHGAEWKLERWEKLGQALETQGGWTEEQIRLAYDLLGLPEEEREPTEDCEEEFEAACEIVASEQERLRLRIERVLEPRDAREHWGAQIGQPPPDMPQLQRLRRCESECSRRMNRALDRLKAGRHAIPVATPPQAVAAPSPTPTSEPASQPPTTPVASQAPDSVAAPSPAPGAPTPPAPAEAPAPTARSHVMPHQTVPHPTHGNGMPSPHDRESFYRLRQVGVHMAPTPYPVSTSTTPVGTPGTNQPQVAIPRPMVPHGYGYGRMTSHDAEQLRRMGQEVSAPRHEPGTCLDRLERSQPWHGLVNLSPVPGPGRCLTQT